jgi:hypothetical protein
MIGPLRVAGLHSKTLSVEIDCFRASGEEHLETVGSHLLAHALRNGKKIFRPFLYGRRLATLNGLNFLFGARVV